MSPISRLCSGISIADYHLTSNAENCKGHTHYESCLAGMRPMEQGLCCHSEVRPLLLAPRVDLSANQIHVAS